MAAFVTGSFYMLTGSGQYYKALAPNAATDVPLVEVGAPAGAPPLVIGSDDTGFLVSTVSAADPGFDILDTVLGPDKRSYRIIASFTTVAGAIISLVCQDTTDATRPTVTFLKTACTALVSA